MSVSSVILAISADPDEISIVLHFIWVCTKGEMISWSEVRRGEYKNIHFARRWNYKYYHTFKQVGKVSTNFAAAKNGKVGSNFSAAKTVK